MNGCFKDSINGRESLKPRMVILNFTNGWTVSNYGFAFDSFFTYFSNFSADPISVGACKFDQDMRLNYF